MSEEEIAVLWQEYLDQYPEPSQSTAGAFIKEYKTTRVPPKPKTKASVRIPLGTNEQLEALANAKGVSKGEIVKKLIDKLYAD